MQAAGRCHVWVPPQCETRQFAFQHGSLSSFSVELPQAHPSTPFVLDAAAPSEDEPTTAIKGVFISRRLHKPV